MLRHKLDQFQEEDFGLFRLSFESGRQSPKNAAKWLLISVLTQSFMFFLLSLAPINHTRMFVFKQVCVSIVFLFTAVLILLSIIYSIPHLYKKQEHIQYKILSLGLSNNIIVIPFFIGLFILIQENNIPDFIYFLLGLLLGLLGLGLYYIIVRKTTEAISNGYFSGPSIANHDGAVKKDKEINSKLPGLIFGGTGLLLILGSSPPFVDTVDGESVFLAILFISVYFFGIHVITMNLIAIYCKERFRSFNFTEEGHLYPWNSGDRLKNKQKCISK